MEFVYTLMIALGLNMAVFFVAYWLKSDKLTDLMYGATFAAIAVFMYLRSDMQLLHTLLFALVILWAIRLAGFLLIRIFEAGKDKRFDGVRENFWKFGQFWFFQGLTAWIIMLPAIYMFGVSSPELTLLAIAGAMLWVVGFVFEATADWQKFSFKRSPKNSGRWIEKGLWRYSRHPNYFGEILMWIGVYVLAAAYLVPWQKLAALAGPVWIAFLLLFVTGIPKLEKHADTKWGKNPEYIAYKKQTPLIIPKIR